MRHRTILVSLVLSLVVVRPGLAQLGVTSEITFAAPEAANLRARLLAHANDVASSDPVEAANALSVRALSFSRDGEGDSAVACYERAFALDPSRRFALADERLRRMAPGDAARAIAVLRPIQPRDLRFPAADEYEAQALLAWAHFLAGRPDSAARLLAPIERRLTGQAHREVVAGPHRIISAQEWRYRLGCVSLGLKDWPQAIHWLMPLAVASRGFDADVMGMMKAAAKEQNTDRHLDMMLRQELQPADDEEDAVVAELGARRVSFTGKDGFTLGGVLLAPPTPGRAAVVLMVPDDPLEYYDTLAVGMRGMGFAVMLLYPRGSGRSVGASCPLPETWRGRETVMQSRCAGDVRQAVRALARETGADTSQYLLVGLGSTAAIAAEAAERDPRAGVLLLASPTASPVDRGIMRARLAALRRPVYFQTGPEDIVPSGALVDTLYQSVDQRASRVADSDREGMRATLFRPDPKVLERFKLWLEETWPSASAPPATPPSGPHKG